MLNESYETMPKRILVGRLADANRETERAVVTLDASGRIAEIAAWTDATHSEQGDLEMPDALLVPGFIDIHIHGGAGRYLMEGTEDALEAVAVHLAKHGVTGFLSTTVTAPWEPMRQAAIVAARAARSSENGRNGAAVLGCHLEGPYINPARKGAQPEQFICSPSIEELEHQLGDDLDQVRIMTLASEMEGALPLIHHLSERGIIASLGHTDATYEQVIKAIAAGAKHTTHTYNAMRPQTGREPGVVGAVLAHPELTAELIWDNIHVHPANCRALIAAKGSEGVILVSDGIPGAGMPDQYRFSLGEQTILISDGSARLPDGTLAGSVLTLDRAFANASRYTLSQRSAMSSRNAAVSLGLGTRKGLIAAGYDADFVLLDKQESVIRTFVAGRCVYTV